MSSSLPRALGARGHEVRLFMPRYYVVDRTRFGLKPVNGPLGVPMGNGEKWGALFESRYLPEITSCFIEYERYYGRDGLYDDGCYAYADNAERFVFFCRAVLQALKTLGDPPDIIHCNDWQTALIPVYLKTLYAKDPFFAHTASVLTVHNAGYQGVFPGETLGLTQIGAEVFNIDGLEYFGQVNFLKGGLLSADAVTTVSPKHAVELQTPEFGYHLAGVFRGIGRRLYGILNGIDEEKWDPARDAYIPCRYSIQKPEGKSACKSALQRRLGLTVDPEPPLLGAISRVTYQKGMDVLIETLFHLMSDERFQFAILGAGDEGIIKKFEHLKRMFPERVGLYWGYDEKLAHLMEAGLDIYLMPSRYEPCGLNQMYSLRYGTIPVVRATGGLDDSVTEWNERSLEGNGFKFVELNNEELYNTIRRVLKVYSSKKHWERLRGNAMGFTYGWNTAVQEYEKVYSAVRKSAEPVNQRTRH